MLRAFIHWNQRICDRIARHIPYSRLEIFERYPQTVSEYMNAQPQQIVIDIGSGKHCPFAALRDLGQGTRIIGVDVSDDELQENRDVDEIRVADVTQGLPFDNQSANLIVSRSALEHFVRLEPFIRDSHRVLTNGGKFIHLLPSKNSPYALLNRALPHSVSRKLLHMMWEESKGWGGFPAYYDHCSYRSLQKVLRQNGFEILSLDVSYYQSQYYRFFIPFYLLSAGYDGLIRALGFKNLSAHLLVVARKIPV